jgi:hypothetical protein
MEICDDFMKEIVKLIEKYTLDGELSSQEIITGLVMVLHDVLHVSK